MKQPDISFAAHCIASLNQLRTFTVALSTYINKRLFFSFYRFEKAKHVVVGGLTAKRGRYIRPFLHTSMTGIFLIGLALAPVVKGVLPEDAAREGVSGSILGQTSQAQAAALDTQISVKPRDTTYTYTIQQGDTLSSIAAKFGLKEATIRWQNNMPLGDKIVVGQELEIPPIDGVVHKVKRGDTIYSIAKKYSVDPQVIVNWPFNSYTDDENFGLAVGQVLVIPEGVKPEEKQWDSSATIAIGKTTPNAGQVSASGSFAWPTTGMITQHFVWYHTALDIANASGPDVLAADSGKIIMAGWPDNSGYANRVIIDHGNGYTTLYAHLAAFYVKEGQTVKRGDPIGKMGNTGRSTGTHLHFEIRLNGANQNPESFLK